MEQKLGRGLAALLGESNNQERLEVPNQNSLDIELIIPNEDQPRKFFDESKINELAGSISLYGVLQPIAVRKKENFYEIIAGERRWRAAKLAGLTRVPVHILDVDNKEIMALALIENIQRSDLNPIEEAEAIKSLISNCECTQDDVGNILCKSRSYIANSVRLLSLPDRVKELIRSGRLSASHGRHLIGIGNAEEIAEVAAQEGWNVKQLQSAMKNLKVGVSGNVNQNENPSLFKTEDREDLTEMGTPISPTQDHESMDIAIRVAESLKVETKLKVTKNGGIFTLVCKTCEELEDLVEKLILIGEI